MIHIINTALLSRRLRERSGTSAQTPSVPPLIAPATQQAPAIPEETTTPPPLRRERRGQAGPCRIGQAVPYRPGQPPCRPRPNGGSVAAQRARSWGERGERKGRRLPPSLPAPPGEDPGPPTPPSDEPLPAPLRAGAARSAGPARPGTHTTAREIIQETIAAAARPLNQPGPNGRGPAPAHPIGSAAERMRPGGGAGPGAAGARGGSLPGGGRGCFPWRGGRARAGAWRAGPGTVGALGGAARPSLSSQPCPCLRGGVRPPPPPSCRRAVCCQTDPRRRPLRSTRRKETDTGLIIRNAARPPFSSAHLCPSKHSDQL